VAADSLLNQSLGHSAEESSVSASRPPASKAATSLSQDKLAADVESVQSGLRASRHPELRPSPRRCAGPRSEEDEPADDRSEAWLGPLR